MEMRSDKLSDFLAQRPIWNVLWFPLFGCNLRCAYCWNHGRFHEATDRDFGQIASNLCSLQLKSCTIAGGEPLLIPQLAGVLNRLKTVTERLRLFTNATRLPALDEIARSDLDELVVSLDSIEPAINEIGREATLETVNGAERISGRRRSTMALCLAVCLTRGSASTLPETLRWAEGTGFEYLQISLVHATRNRSNFAIGLECLSREAAVKLLEYVCDVVERSRFLNTQQVLAFLSVALRYYREGDLPEQHCGATRKTVTVNPNGLVFPCPQVDIALGDLKIESLSQSIARWRGILDDADLQRCKNSQCLHMYKRGLPLPEGQAFGESVVHSLWTNRRTAECK